MKDEDRNEKDLQNSTEAPARQLIHLDADAFFASVEQAADPRLRGKAIAVGGEKRGIVASASYEARRYGIRTPMPTARARKLCPHLIVLPGDYEKYERFSRWMFSYAYDFTPYVEITSIDEGYFDLTRARQSPVAIARTIRDAIRQALKITVSEGIGANKLVSQIASKLHKPAAFLEVPIGKETLFLHPLPNQWLPGVGPKTCERLNAAGLARIGQVAATPLELLELLVGPAASALRRFAQGADDRPVRTATEPAKSYSQQETFPQDQTDEEFIQATLRHMADRLMTKVRADGKAVRTLTVKVRYNDMAEDQCGESLLEPTDLETDLYGPVCVLLRKAWKRRVSLRLVSLKLSNVYDLPAGNELALDRNAEQHEARRRLARVLDEIRQARGHYVIQRGHDLVLREAASEAGRPSPMPPTPRTERRARPAAVSQPQLRAVPLGVRSCFSFLNSTLSPETIVAWAMQHDLSAIAMADQGNLHGAAAFAQAAREAGVQPVLGAEVRVGQAPVWLYVENVTGYRNLCRLLSPAPESLYHHPPSALGNAEGLIAVSGDVSLARFFPGRFYAAVLSPDDLQRMTGGREPAVAVQPAYYATPADRWKFGVVQSIRTRTLLRQRHPDKLMDGEFHLPSADELAGRFRDHPEVLERTREIAERCAGFEFPFGPPQFPAFRPPDGSASREFLRRLVFAGARERYPTRQASVLGAQLETELRIIHEVGYEDYFLVVWDILQECRRRGIDWITRGSAADSLVCYCLGISGVCPLRFDLYFRRFLNRERMALHKLPDIDVDFPHDRKDDVLDLIFEKYGAEHCAVVGGFNTYKARGAVGDVAKVLGVSEYQSRRFTEHFPWNLPVKTEDSGPRAATDRAEAAASDSASCPLPSALVEALRTSPECRDLPLEEEPYRTAIAMAVFLDGFPRYPKMHPCGVVLSRQPMHELTPTFLSQKGYPTTHYDMDAVEAIGLVKIDILAQGGLAVMRDVKDLLGKRGIDVDVEKSQVRGSPSPISNLQSPISNLQSPISNRETGHRQPTHVPASCDAQSKKTYPPPTPPTDSPDASHLPLPACRPPSAVLCPPPSPSNGFDDAEVWEMIASGGARAVHHIESPAMISLCRMTNVREIDGLIAIVSVIRPGAANEQKKVKFTRRYQGLEPPYYPDPSLESCLRSTYGLVVYEEHILQICEAFAGLDGGQADVLRRALVKQKWNVVERIGKEFVAAARARGHTPERILEVWELVTGFNGYAFCKAHSTAYGVEAYQSAWLKRYFPAEFMAAVLTQGKGFYPPLVYVLECDRLGIPLLPPRINAPGPQYKVEGPGPKTEDRRPKTGVSGPMAGGGWNREQNPGNMPHHSPFSPHCPPSSVFCLLSSDSPQSIRVPVTQVRGLTACTVERLLRERERSQFESVRDCYLRVKPQAEEMEALIRVGAFDEFGQSRTRQFWEFRQVHRAFGNDAEPGQDWLLPPPGVERLPEAPLTEPDRRQRLQWEAELLGFPASGHPLELHDPVAWNTYCPIARLGEHLGEEVVTCGLVIEQRVHHQITGEPMKFLTLCDWTGVVETELFAATYRSYGLATVRYPVLEIGARVEPFENGRGHTLRVLRAGQPRLAERAAVR